MIPGGTVVAGPGGAVALASCEAGARHHEGPLIRAKREQPLIGTARVLHAINVVDLQMRSGALAEAGLVDAMLNIVGHGLGRRLKDRRLIHIVPKSGHTLIDEGLVERAPPLPRL